MTTESSTKVAQMFSCKTCAYVTVRKSNYDKHLSTSKHEKTTNNNEKVAKVADKITLGFASKYDCHFCLSQFNDRAGLWRHKKKCTQKPAEKDGVDNKNLMLTLITQNNELQKQMLDIIKSGTVSNSTVNSHNKTFNLQLYLNETCKDAMNIMDFVDSIKFQLSDLESVGELGYIKGISNIIIRNLKALDENMRPVHCSDLRREKLYVKDAGKWEKEAPDNKILKNAIKYIAHKNVKMIPAFREKYPDCIYSESRKSDQYNRLIIEAMGGDGNDEDAKSNKIITKIAKEILIDKGVF